MGSARSPACARPPTRRRPADQVPFGSDFPEADELEIEKIECPTLVVYGEHSALLIPEEAEFTCDRFPRGKLVELPDTFHHIMLDRPHAFNRVLLEFFQENGF